jgi:hypothetical protein
MRDIPTNDIPTRIEPEGWMQDNDRGLALAADQDWAEACEAFAAAADSLARSLPSTEGHHEPLALVLSNLAQASFRAGRVDEALQHAQRVCALRVAIAGEDAMPVGRARMDLAVMLASRGRLDEASTLVQRAMCAMEHHVADDDARLAMVLENAARISLAAGSAANAEPLLLRLHALLDAHEMSTDRAEQLAARVATARSLRGVAEAPAVEAPAAEAPAVEALAVEASAVEAPAVEAPAVEAPAIEALALTVAHEAPEQPSAFEDDLPSRVYAHAAIEAHETWDDHPLRDAVALTDVLLRATPSGVPIVPVTTPIAPPLLIANGTGDVSTTPTASDAFASLSFDPTDDAPAALESQPSEAPLVAVDLSLAALLPTPTGASPIDTTMPGSGMVLESTVTHGVVGDKDEAPMPQAAPVSPPILQVLPDLPTTVEPPPVPVPQIMPQEIHDGAPPALADHPVSRAPEEQVVLPPAAEKQSGSGKLIAMLAGALAAAGGAAAYFLRP